MDMKVCWGKGYFMAQCNYSKIWRLLNGICFALGNGERLQFWTDEWIPRTVLRFAFPRIYAFAVNKVGRVREFGKINNGRCVKRCRINLSENILVLGTILLNLSVPNSLMRMLLTTATGRKFGQGYCPES
ncbi:hypothetical protein PTKIN_Ptkin14bG0191500 [Pterospermum kingtungense]